MEIVNTAMDYWNILNLYKVHIFCYSCPPHSQIKMIRCKLMEKDDDQFYIKFLLKIENKTMMTIRELPDLDQVSKVKEEFKQYLKENTSNHISYFQVSPEEYNQVIENFKCDETIQKPIGYPM